MKDFFLTVKDRLGIASEFLRFLWKQKLWWLIPMVLMLLFVGLVIVLSQTPAVAPFIYTLF